MTSPEQRAEGLMKGIEQIREDLTDVQKRKLAVGIIGQGIRLALHEFASELAVRQLEKMLTESR